MPTLKNVGQGQVGVAPMPTLDKKGQEIIPGPIPTPLKERRGTEMSTWSHANTIYIRKGAEGESFCPISVL